MVGVRGPVEPGFSRFLVSGMQFAGPIEQAVLVQGVGCRRCWVEGSHALTLVDISVMPWGMLILLDADWAVGSQRLGSP